MANPVTLGTVEERFWSKGNTGARTLARVKTVGEILAKAVRKRPTTSGSRH